MALTIDTVNKEGPLGFSGSEAISIDRYPVALDNSYPTGGYAISPADLGIPEGFRILDGAFVNGAARVYSKWDAATEKLIMTDIGGTEIANATDLSLYNGDAEVLRY